MNIFELTKFLNERAQEQSTRGRKAYPEVIKMITNNAKELISKSRKSGDSSIEQRAEKFLTNLNGQINFVKTEVSQDVDENSFLSKIIERLKGFKVSSNQNVWNGIRQIVSDLNAEEMKIILEVVDKKTLTEVKNLGSLVNNRQVGYNELGVDIDRMKSFMQNMANFRPSGCGPYEVLLCLLFKGEKCNGAETIGNKTYRGDIKINGVIYEVKREDSGVIDAGLGKIKEEMRKMSGDDLEEMRQKYETAKKMFRENIKNGYKLVEEFAKKLSNEQRARQIEDDFTKVSNNKEMLSKETVDTYFDVLSEEDKKRAVLYGFFNLGYRNIVVCKNDVNQSIRVLTEKEIESVINGTGTVKEVLGVDIKFKNNTSATTSFGSAVFEMR